MKLFNDLILVRHGESVLDNSIPNDLLPLTEAGIKQAKEAQKILQNKFDIVISSTSKRAIMTAKIIAEGKKTLQDERLIERGWGNKGKDGKETDEEARTRFLNFLIDILNLYKYRRILIVTHGSLIKLAQDVIEGKILKRDIVNNCTIIKYDKNKNKEILKR